MSAQRETAPKMQIALVMGGLAVVGILALAGGWMARSWFDRSAPPPTSAPTSAPTVTTAAATPTFTPVVPPTPTAGTEEAGPRPTATLRPTSAASPAPETVTVRAGEGLYAVCRRYCPGRWGPGVPPGLMDYARRVANLNGLVWEPVLYGGQQLKMPPCPQP